MFVSAKIRGLFLVLITLSTYLYTHSQNGAEGFNTLEISGVYSKGFGEFGSKAPNGLSGFALGGGGLMLTGTVQHQGDLFRLGAGIKTSLNWQRVHHLALGEELDKAYATPAALGTDYLVMRRNWLLSSLLAGPVAGFDLGPIMIEGRFLIGFLESRNPQYFTDQGTFVPSGWGKFYLTPENETNSSQRKVAFAMSPEVLFRIPVGWNWGLQLQGSAMSARLKQEMEIIDTIETPTGVSFQRRQESFQQKVQYWSVGVGAYMRFN